MAERSRVEVTARLRGARKFQAEARASARSVDQIGDAANRADAKIMGLNARIMLMRTAFRLVKWPALIAGFGVAAGAVGALSAGIIGLTSALADAFSEGSNFAQAEVLAQLIEAGWDVEVDPLQPSPSRP